MARGFGAVLLLYTLFAKEENRRSQFCQPRFQASLERDGSITGRRIIAAPQVEERGVLVSRRGAELALNAQQEA